MTQNINQFAQTAERGQVALLNADSFTMSAIIDSTESSTLKAGDAVKIVTTSKGLPHVVKADATDAILGYIVFNPVKNEGLVAGDRVELAITGSFIYLVAGEAIDAGDSLMLSGSSLEYVAVHDTTVTANAVVCGIALDAAAAKDDLLRVYVKSL